ncbi:MAG: hypothetical protein E6R03_09240 [Hyphomicrobiaceae bacterium]|nr:MAG: hypothetical protein E6R03_09240 [Hyphomicrobiaceae bacterium]
MSSKVGAKWIIPVDVACPENNVWVMITKGKDADGIAVHSLRVFTDEPHPTMVEYQTQLFSEHHETVEVDVFEVAIDYFDKEELDIYSC